MRLNLTCNNYCAISGFNFNPFYGKAWASCSTFTCCYWQVLIIITRNINMLYHFQNQILTSNSNKNKKFECGTWVAQKQLIVSFDQSLIFSPLLISLYHRHIIHNSKNFIHVHVALFSYYNSTLIMMIIAKLMAHDTRIPWNICDNTQTNDKTSVKGPTLNT